MVERVRSASLAALAALAAHAATAAPAWAANPVAIEGLPEGAREAIRALLPQRDKPATPLDAERLAEEAAMRAHEWLRSEGYYEAQVQTRVVEAPLAAAVTIAPGRRFLFEAPALEFEGEAPSDAAQEKVLAALAGVQAGAPARAGSVLAAEAAALNALKSAGYSEAETAARRAIVDHAVARMRVTFRFKAGSAVRLGGLSIAPAGVLQDQLIARVRAWAPGDPASPEALALTRKALSSTGVFGRVRLDVAPPGPDGLSDVVANTELSEPRTLSLSGSWSTSEGAGATADWAYRNALELGETFSTGLTLAELEQRARIGLDFPHSPRLNQTRRYALEAFREDYEPYLSEGVTATGAIEAMRSARFALTYGVSTGATFYDAASGVKNAYTATAFLESRWNRTDSELDPRNGFRVRARVEPGVATGDAGVGFVQGSAETTAYHGLGASDRVVLAGRLRGGWTAPVWGIADDLPLERRFYAGGGGSVRGYSYRSLYPDAEHAGNDAPGGQGLVETSLEARARVIGKWSAAAFVDGASVFDTVDAADGFRWGAGVGVRYDLGFGPLRVDVAAPLHPRPQDDKLAFYVSIGQAF